MKSNKNDKVVQPVSIASPLQPKSENIGNIQSETLIKNEKRGAPWKNSKVEAPSQVKSDFFTRNGYFMNFQFIWQMDYCCSRESLKLLG